MKFLLTAALSVHRREISPHQSVFLDETPSFFPDGTRVAFQSNRSGRMEIWTVNTNGTNLRQLTGRSK